MATLTERELAEVKLKALHEVKAAYGWVSDMFTAPAVHSSDGNIRNILES